MPGFLGMLAQGFANAGQNVAAFAGDAATIQMKSDLERQSQVLASQLATERQHQQNIETGAPEDVALKRLQLGRTRAQLAGLGLDLDDQGNITNSSGSGATPPTTGSSPVSTTGATATATDADPVIIGNAKGDGPVIRASQLPPGLSIDTARQMALQSPDKLFETIAEWHKPHDVRPGSDVTTLSDAAGGVASVFHNAQQIAGLPSDPAARAALGIDKNDRGYLENGKPVILHKDNPNSPFNDDGTPNVAAQQWEIQKARETKEPSVDRSVVLPILEKMRSGETLTAGEEKVLATVKPGAAPAADDASVQTIAHAIANYQQAPLTGFVLRSPWGQAVSAAVYKENPDYRAPQYNASNRAQTAFTSGTQGNSVRSLSVAISHLGTLGDLSDALKNGDVQVINRVANTVKEQLGYPAPTNFNAAKQVVGQEITKAILASGGGVTERQEAEKQLSAANSPAQIAGIVQTYKRLLAGQLGGLRRQYETATGAKNFEDMLSPEAKQELESLPESTGAGRQTNAAPAAVPIPAQAASQLRQGTITTFGNGQRWTLGADGNPTQVQ